MDDALAVGGFAVWVVALAFGFGVFGLGHGSFYLWFSSVGVSESVCVWISRSA